MDRGFVSVMSRVSWKIATVALRESPSKDRLAPISKLVARRGARAAVLAAVEMPSPAAGEKDWLMVA